MKDISFPTNFLWGASTSAHQVEGNNYYNDWWRWEKKGFTPPSGKACDHYSLYKDDFSMAKKLSHNTHRFGIEWSRVQKDPKSWDQKEWEHYKNVINELLKLNIIPIPTLNHFTIPSWIEDIGGWSNNETIELFTNFAIKAMQELGNKIEYWIPFNEPHMLAFIGFFYGNWPPYIKKPNVAFLILKNILKAHVNVYIKMNREAKKNPELIKPKIGIAKAVGAFHPNSILSLKDIHSTENRDFAHNHSFITSCINGKLCIPGLETEKLETSKTLDFIGLNYYYRQFIKHDKPFYLDPLGETAPDNSKKIRGKITDMGWEVYPKGIYDLVRNFSRYNLPIMIAENGIATNNDKYRVEFLQEHLRYLIKALRKGYPLIGYLHWSLLDNFEWSEGYTKKFGLIDIDLITQKRTIRQSAQVFSSIIKNGRI